MLDENILDYYHLCDHVIASSHVLYGEGTGQAQTWREQMMGYVWNQGSLAMLDRLGNYLRCHRSGPTESFCGTLTTRLKGRGMR
ncbi:MAG: hypothetical protein GWP14_00545 [Actinobacteria bacterium]|nr:hypothetical protein [Actinomycetota bacterium]